MFIDDCLEGIRRLMDSEYRQPINLGSERMVAIDELTKMVIDISGKDLKIEHVSGPVGVNGRNSDNKIIRRVLRWEPNIALEYGLIKTYDWIKEQVKV